jgi:hypothetical protein
MRLSLRCDLKGLKAESSSNFNLQPMTNFRPSPDFLLGHNPSGCAKRLMRKVDGLFLPTEPASLGEA